MFRLLNSLKEKIEFFNEIEKVPLSVKLRVLNSNKCTLANMKYNVEQFEAAGIPKQVYVHFLDTTKKLLGSKISRLKTFTKETQTIYESTQNKLMSSPYNANLRKLLKMMEMTLPVTKTEEADEPPKASDLVKEKNYEKIAGILTTLEFIRDPSIYKWRIGSIQTWETKSGIKWGYNLYSYLFRYVEDYEEWFISNILPFLPSIWKKNYIIYIKKCPYNWDELVEEEKYQEIGEILSKTGEKNKGKWGLGSLTKWGYIANSFDKWTKRYIPDKDLRIEWLRAKILPWMSTELKETFNPISICPYNWDLLLAEENHQEVGRILSESQCISDPAENNWTFRSLERFTPWGKSFVCFVEQKGISDPIKYFDAY